MHSLWDDARVLDPPSAGDAPLALAVAPRALDAPTASYGEPGIWPRPRGGPFGLIEMQRLLHAAGSIEELFARASEVARELLDAPSTLVLSLAGNTLAATHMRALRDARSDALRRRVLAEPIPLLPGTVEAEFVRLAEGGRGKLRQGPSELGRRLELQHFALGAVLPEDRVIALFVVERSAPWSDPSEWGQVQTFAQMVSSSLERLVTRHRMTEIGNEMRYMASSAQAVVAEGLESPISLPLDQHPGPVYGMPDQLVPSGFAQLQNALTRREFSIAKELIAGRSNREIAAALQLSPETVKKYVSRVMRKVGATSRAEAAVRCMSITQPHG